MELDELGEFGLIERIKAGAIVRDYPGLVGIGDDCAVFRSDAGRDILLTTDLLIERVHFLRDRIGARLLGRKSISVNLSDIAACGGVPKEAFVSVAVPDGISVEYLEELFTGLRDRAHEFEVNILGGDTTSSAQDLVISIALTGEVKSGRAMLRSGAREGDLIFLTGPVGDSAAGLVILNDYLELADEFGGLLLAHHDPQPHVAEGQVIGKSGLASAMIDVSDGVATDLGHICRASGLGARVEWTRIPLSTAFREYATRAGADQQRLALAGGEDYVLLLTAGQADGRILAGLLAEKCDGPLYEIGIMTAESDIELILPDGRATPLVPVGWDHFRCAR